MKTLSIVYGSDITTANGVNYVTNLFVIGKDILKENGYNLDKIYHPNGIIDCKDTDWIFQVNNSAATPKPTYYNILRKVKNIKILPITLLHFWHKHYRPAKKAYKIFLENNNSQYVIFQDNISAYLYDKRLFLDIKSILILHTGITPWTSSMQESDMFRYQCTKDWYKRMVKKAIRNTNKLVVLSEVASEGYDWVENNDKTFIYNGIPDISKIKPHKKDSDTINLCCVASLIKRKGQKLLIEAIKLLDSSYRGQIKLHIIGDGIDRTELEQLIALYSLENEVVLYGNRSDIPEILANMDVFILASFDEGLPISIIEALRQGLYIMTSDVGACKEMIDHHVGEIIELDPTKIALSIKNLIDRGGVYDDTYNLSRKKYIDNFSLDAMMINYCKVLDTL